MAKKAKASSEKPAKDSNKTPWSTRASSTLGSIALGLGALTFAFALVYSDSVNSNSMLQRLMVGSQGGGDGMPGQPGGQNLAPQTLGPEGRLDGQGMNGGAFAPPAQINGMQTSRLPPMTAPGQVRGDNANGPGSIESYLDNAWGGPQPGGNQLQAVPGTMQGQGMPQGGMMPNNMAGMRGNMMGGNMRGNMMRGNMRAMMQNRMMQGNMMQRGNMMQGNMMQGNFGGTMANNQPQQKKSWWQQLLGGGDGSGKDANSARGEVEYQLERARSSADQASTHMDRARDLENADEKREAASEARYYANEARVAADQAASRASGIDELQSLVSEVRAQANRANSCAQYAADAASGW